MWKDIIKSTIDADTGIKNKGRIIRGISRVITTYEFDADSEHIDHMYEIIERAENSKTQEDFDRHLEELQEYANPLPRNGMGLKIRIDFNSEIKRINNKS